MRCRSVASLAAWTSALWLVVHMQARVGPAPPRPSQGPVPLDVLAADRLPQLESLGDGRLRHRGAGFTATIHPDGRVEFRDVREHDFKLFGFDLRKRRLEAAPIDQRHPLIVDFEERAMFPMGRLPVMGFSGRMGGLADWTLGQKHGAAKRAFLEATAGLRFRLSYAWQRARMQERLAALGDELVALWRDPKLSAAERRRRLFELWDECAEADSASTSPIDALLGAAGEAARGKIVGFIRVVASPGSDEAFTAEELARLNASRRSRGRFAPYEGEIAAATDLPELPALPAARRSDEAEAVDVYGPEPEPAVTMPERPPEPARPVQKPRREHLQPKVRVGPISIPVGRR